MQFFLTYPIGPFSHWVQFLQVTYQKGSSPIKEFMSKNLAHFWRVLLLPRAWVGGYRGSRQKTPNKTSPTVVPSRLLRLSIHFKLDQEKSNKPPDSYSAELISSVLYPAPACLNKAVSLL